MNVTTTAALVVVYSDHLERCRAFYTDLGMRFVLEQHGTGPEHYAAELPGGLVLELYPATARRPVSSNRLGFHVAPDTVDLAPGHHVLEDPDGRAVEVHVDIERNHVITADQARATLLAEFGEVDAEITEHASGALSITVRAGDRVAVIDGTTSGQWGLSISPEDSSGFAGHDDVADSLDEIASLARKKLAV